MAGRQEQLQRELVRLQEQLRGDRAARPVRNFLDGLIGGLILGAALALLAVRRAAAVGMGAPQEASIELKERATQLAQPLREGAQAIAEQSDTLTQQAKATLDRVVPGDNATES